MFTLTIFEVIVLFSVVICCLFATYLWFTAKGDRFAHRILAGLLIIIALIGIDGLLIALGIIFNYPALANILTNFGFLFGPALYFYTRALLGVKRHFTLNDVIHLTPFGLASLYNILLFHLHPSDQKRAIFFEGAGLWSQYIATYHLLGLLTFGAYILACFWTLHKQGLRLRLFFSNIQNYRLSWIRSIIGVFAAIVVIRIILFAVPVPFGEFVSFSNGATVIWLIWLLLPLSAILLLVYNGLKQHPIFVSSALLDQLADNAPGREPQLEEDLTPQAEEISAMIKLNEWFLDPEINLADLARNLHLDTQQLSRLINVGLKKNFFTLINDFRCNYAATLLLSRDETILNIMLESGFNSKTAFNRAFKDHFGVTPSQYKNNKPPA